jgi:hypothetical protein
MRTNCLVYSLAARWYTWGEKYTSLVPKPEKYSGDDPKKTWTDVLFGFCPKKYKILVPKRMPTVVLFGSKLEKYSGDDPKKTWTDVLFGFCPKKYKISVPKRMPTVVLFGSKTGKVQW